MNDKYQEALDILRNIEQSHNYKKIGSSLAPESDLLQELVDKATPKKFKMSTAVEYDQIEKDWYEKYYYNCPNCDDNLIDTPNYCPNCGQKIDWGNYET